VIVVPEHVAQLQPSLLALHVTDASKAAKPASRPGTDDDSDITKARSEDLPHLVLLFGGDGNPMATLYEDGHALAEEEGPILRG
jgi:hypothetical protein